MKFTFLIIFLVMIIFTSLVQAETTFFDNPDDAFIVSSSATGGVIITEEQQASGGYSGGCLYKWNCTNWSECFPSGKQTRNCINTGTCPDTYQFPEIEQICNYTGSPEKTKEYELFGGTKITGKIIKGDISQEDKILVLFILVLIFSLVIFYLVKQKKK